MAEKTGTRKSKKEDSIDIKPSSEGPISWSDLTSLIEKTVSQAVTKATTEAMGGVQLEIKDMRTQIASLDLKLSTTTKDLVSTVESLAGRIKAIEGQLDDFSHQPPDQLLSELPKRLETMDKTVNTILKDTAGFHKSINDADQQSRALNIRITGLKLNHDTATLQVISLLRDKLNYNDIKPSDITNVTQLGKKNSPTQSTAGFTPVVVVTFQTKPVRDAILRRRRELKGTGIGLSEDLTRINANFIATNRKDPRIMGIWSWNGKIFILTSKDGPKKQVEPTLPLDIQL